MKEKEQNIRQQKLPRLVRWLEFLDLGDRLTYDQIFRHIPYVLLLFVLGLIYVGNAFYAERNLREINAINKTLNEKRWYYMTTKFDLERQSIQSKLGNALASRGLKELTTPPVKINVTKVEDEH